MVKWFRSAPGAHMTGLVLAVSITMTMLVLAWAEPEPIRWLENALLDARFILRGERHPGQEVVVVAIDERSLKEVGRWPWSRDQQAALVQAIAAHEPKVIGLDIIYAEPEITESRRTLQELRTAAPGSHPATPSFVAFLNKKLSEADTDQQFAHSLRDAGNVVLALPLLVHRSQPGIAGSAEAKPVPTYLKRSKFKTIMRARGDETLEPLRATDSSPPLQMFADEALSLGHVYSLPDPQGMIRHEYLALRYGEREELYPSLSLEVARLYLDVPKEQVVLRIGQDIQVGATMVPTDRWQRMLIDYLGPQGLIPTVSATDVLHDRIPSETLKDKAVLVGTTALGTYDQKAVPFSANFSGVEKNATVVENIIHGRFLGRSRWGEPIEAGLILVFGLSLGIMLPRVRALTGTTIAALLFLGYAGTAQYLFVTRGLWLDVVYPMMTMAMVFVSITVLRFIAEEKRAREIRAIFSSYVSPQIVSELIRDPEKAKIGGQRKELTMLFSDVVGFTAFCEQHPAEQVVAQLNEYLDAMTEVIFRWNGTLDKFVGDTVMAFWGAPLDQPDHAELAVKCALHMRKRLTELQAQWRARGLPPLETGIGINTGGVLVGNIGADRKKMDYTIIGDQVNLAARIEGLTRKFDAHIVISESTAERLKPLINGKGPTDQAIRLGHVAMRRLGDVRVKGKQESVVIYGLTSLPHSEASVVVEDEALSETVEMTLK